jgi:hypothetical protein
VGRDDETAKNTEEPEIADRKLRKMKRITLPCAIVARLILV